MKTEQLIQAMAADTERPRPVETDLPVALGLGATASGLVFLSTMGIRPDLAQALTLLPVLLKHLLPWLVALAGFGLVLRLSRPGAEPGRWPLLLLAVPMLLGGAMFLEASRVGAAGWAAEMKGTSLATCLVSIILLSIPIAAGALWVLQRGASTQPALTGAMAGLMSGGIAAGLYAFYCYEDSPLFYGVWYVVAVLVVAGGSALAGRRFLRW